MKEKPPTLLKMLMMNIVMGFISPWDTPAARRLTLIDPKDIVMSNVPIKRSCAYQKRERDHSRKRRQHCDLVASYRHAVVTL